MLFLDERGLVSSPNARVSATLDTAHGNPTCTNRSLRQIAANDVGGRPVVLRARVFGQADFLAHLHGTKPGPSVTAMRLAKDPDGAW